MSGAGGGYISEQNAAISGFTPEGKVATCGKRVIFENGRGRHPLRVWVDHEGVHIGCTTITVEAFKLLVKQADELLTK